MEEHVFIESTINKNKFKNWTFFWFALSVLTIIAWFACNLSISLIDYNYNKTLFIEQSYLFDTTENRYRYYCGVDKSEGKIIFSDDVNDCLSAFNNGEFSSYFRFIKNKRFVFYNLLGTITIYLHWLTLLILLLTLIVFYGLKNSHISITNMNVTGTTWFGKLVVLPIHMISSYSTRKIFSTIAITTTSGVIKFGLIKNYKEIGEVLSTLINQRQENTEVTQATPIITQQPTSNLDELKKLKELLDMGIISQEEFDVKKKQLLGL